jgi:hypothetical protein
MSVHPALRRLLAATACVAAIGVSAATSFASAVETAAPDRHSVSSPRSPDPSLPDGTEDGTVMPPSRDVAAVKARQEVSRLSSSSTSDPVTGYRTTAGLHLRRLNAPYRPYDDKPVLPLPTATAPSTTTTTTSGTTVQHPVRLAQASFLYANSYRVTGNRAYLDAAVKAADKLLATRVEVGPAWFYPYDFDFAVHGDTTQTLQAPWYSAMAQGYALTAFARLAEYSGDARWVDAARATFESMTLGPAADRPWVSWVDADKNLWLEEYPRPGVTDSEKVLNGHGFALYGLYDYWQLTGDSRALPLISGAVATHKSTVLPAFRVPNEASYYSLHHKVQTITYHLVHGTQFLSMYQMVDQPWYAQSANLYRVDFPSRGTAGTVLLTSRARVAYRLDSSRHIVASRAVAFTRDTSAPGNRRERTADGRVMLRISSGPYTDWWFPEAYGSAWYAGPKEVHTYRPRPLTIQLLAGTYTGYLYDRSGRRASWRTVTFATDRTIRINQTAVVDARGAFQPRPGEPLAGYWVPFPYRLRFLP